MATESGPFEDVFNHLFVTETIPEKRKTQISKCSFLGILLVHFFRFWVQKAAMPKSLTGNPQPELQPIHEAFASFVVFQLSHGQKKHRGPLVSMKHWFFKKGSKHNGFL